VYLLPMTSNPIPVTLIGGYLGSGKTTLINHLLNQAQDHRIAVLVNDFGELAIDAALIETTKDNIISLSGGCVCCSYGNDLSNALLDVLAMDTAPDQIVIEASGVAMPGAIASSLSLIPQLLIHIIIVLANAELIRTQANDRYVGDTIERQLNSADLLVLNKIDLLESEQLGVLQQWVSAHWPATKSVCVENAQLPASIILDTIVSTDSMGEILANEIVDKSNRSTAHENKYSRQDSTLLTHASLFSTFKVDVPERVDASTLATLLASEEAQLLRAKGFVQSTDGSIKLLQVVGRRWTTTTAAADSINNTGLGIVCIGLAHTTNAFDIYTLINKQINA
jgi:G3E family GTPase